MDKGTGLQEQKFVTFPCGKQPEGFTDSIIVQSGMTEAEATNFAEALNSTNAFKCGGFSLGNQFETFTLPAAPISIKQKINFLFTIKGQKRKKINVNIPLHFDGTKMDDVLAVKASLEGLTGLSIGDIEEVSYKQMGRVRV